MGTLGQVVSSSGTRAFWRPLSYPPPIVTPRPRAGEDTPQHQMGGLDLSLFSAQRARATWLFLWEGGCDRGGMACSLNFSETERPSATCLRPRADRQEEAFHGYGSLEAVAGGGSPGALPSNPICQKRLAIHIICLIRDQAGEILLTNFQNRSI